MNVQRSLPPKERFIHKSDSAFRNFSDNIHFNMFHLQAHYMTSKDLRCCFFKLKALVSINFSCMEKSSLDIFTKHFVLSSIEEKNDMRASKFVIFLIYFLMFIFNF